MDRIFIEGIEFYGYHGASDEEQRIGHRYVVDVEIEFDLSKAGRSDALADTIDYSAVAALVSAAGSTEQHRLLESLAESIAAKILEQYPVESVRITVRKIAPPMNVIAACAGVDILRRRPLP